MPVDSEFDRQVIADVLSAEKYAGVVTMWPFVSKVGLWVTDIFLD